MLVVGVLFEPFGSSEKCSIILHHLKHVSLLFLGCIMKRWFLVYLLLGGEDCCEWLACDCGWLFECECFVMCVMGLGFFNSCLFCSIKLKKFLCCRIMKHCVLVLIWVVVMWLTCVSGW